MFRNNLTSAGKAFAAWMGTALMVVALLLAAPSGARAAVTWANNYGTAAANSYVYASATDSAGNVYITGNFAGATLTLGTTTLTRIGIQDSFVAKLDTAGTVQWAKNYGGNGARMVPSALTVDSSGNVYFNGYFRSANLTTPALTLTGALSWDIFVIKLNSTTGDTTWSKNFGGAEAYLLANGLAVDPSGNVYVSGTLNANVTAPADAALTKIGTADAFAFKLDPSGSTIWAKNFGGAGASLNGRAVAVDSSGNVYLTADFSGANLTTPVVTQVGVTDSLAIKLDSTGAVMWTQQFGGVGVAVTTKFMTLDGSGNVYLTGRLNGANLTAPAAAALTKIGSDDLLAIKLDGLGGVTWSKNFGGVGASVTPQGIRVDADGNVYVGGYFSSANLTAPALTRIGTTDAFALRLDSTGMVNWSANYGGAGANTYARGGIGNNGSNNLYLSGYFTDANLTSPALTKIGLSDVFILKQAVTPPGLTAPAAPTGATATPGNAQLSVAFTPGADGGSTITGYSVSCTSSDGGTAGSNTGSASPIVVSGLTNGKSYTCTVTATNAIGTGSASTASSAANPAVLPVLNTPSATSSSANLSTFGFQADSSGAAYFTVIAGAGTCPAAAVLEAHSGSPLYWGSTPLTANVAASYTLRNLTASTAYKLCAVAKSGATYSIVQEQTFTTNAASTLSSTWSAVGGAGFTAGESQDVSLSIAPGGTLYVAYQDVANSGKTTVMKYSGGAWSLVGSAGFSAGSGVSNSLTFAPDGTPYVAYRDNGNSSKVTVMKFDGANWAVVGSAGFSVGIVSSPSLSFAPDGTPYLAFVDNGNGAKATVMKFDGANWVTVGSAGFSAGLALLTSLAFAPDGTPYVAYKEDQGSNKATVMKFDGANWVAVGSTAFSAGAITSLSLAITPDGTPYVAYRDGANSLKATVMKFDGADWVVVGSAGFTVGSANYVHLAFAPDGTPYLAYRAGSGTDRVSMMKYSGDTWSTVGNANFSAGDAASTSLAFAPDGTPYVAYQDDGNSGKATVMKLASDATAPDAPTIGSATAGNGSVSVAFSPPENNGGAAITEYTASCAPATANQFAAVWTASQTGSASPLTVSGLTNGTAYKCEVKASNSAGYGTYSGASASVTPAAPASTPSGGNDNTTPPPPPTTQVDLPTGGGTAKPTEGQTVTVTDNGKEGSGIDLPPPPTAPSAGTTGTPPPAGIHINLPGTGTVSVSSDSSGTKLGVQGVKMPGETTSVSTVMVTQGSASFTATQAGQPIASLKNGIFVVSGATDSKVTVDATGPDTKIGVTSSDTIVVPTGSTNVAGTSVDLPPPTATGGAASSVSVKIGTGTLTIQANQPDTTMTFKVVDIGGVQTPILAVTGSAQVSGSGDNQPIVSVAGNVIRTGKSGGGGGQVCNTIVQASSDSSSDAVHVVTCYIVLDAGTFSAMSGKNGGGNGFAAIKDGIVWAGETAEFDKSGKVTSAYLGSRLGLSDAVGDDMAPGGNKFTVGGYNVNAFIPRIAGTPLRLNGAKLDESIFAVVNQALGVTVQPALPVQSDQGVLNFIFAGNLAGQGVQTSQVNYTIDANTASILPSRRIRVDTSRADGVSISAEGEVDVTTGGLVTTFVPSVVDPKAFAEKINQALPGATNTLRWNGTWQVAAADGTTYVGRPQWSHWVAAPGAATFSTTADGNVLFSNNGRSQPLFPDFYDYDTLQATFRTELKDPTLTVLPRMDGTAATTVNGQSYTLAPKWNLVKPVAGKPAWWVEGDVVYIKNADGTAQGFTVK